MTAQTFLLLVLLGAAVGSFGTVVGTGGGFILTPVLLLLYPHQRAATLATISLTVVFFNAASGSVAYGRQRRIDYRSGVIFALATLPGAVAGALLVGVAPRRAFDAATAVLLGALAVWLIAGGNRNVRAHDTGGAERTIVDRAGTVYRYHVRTWRGAAFSLGIGFVSSFLGIGGGVMHVPVLVHALGFPVHVATATSQLVLANMAAVGTVTHAVSGAFAHGVGLRRTLALSIGVVGGAQLGAWLSQRLHGNLIQRLLALALVALAVRLLVTVV